MDQDTAQIWALRAFEWLLGNDEIRSVFMGATGMDPDGLRAGAGEPHTWTAVMEFISMDDAWVLSFCEQSGLPPENFLQIQAALPGGEREHWT